MAIMLDQFNADTSIDLWRKHTDCTGAKKSWQLKFFRLFEVCCWIMNIICTLEIYFVR